MCITGQSKNLVDWKPSFNIGNADIDRQHKELVDIINDLHASMTKGTGNKELINIMERLTRYTKEHFDFEENLLKKINHPNLQNQIKEHRRSIEKFEEFNSKLKKEKININLMNELQDYLKNWLKYHILGQDQNDLKGITKL